MFESKVSFYQDKENDFYSAVKSKVSAYFQENHLSTLAPLSMKVKAVTLYFILICCYISIMSGRLSASLALIPACLMGIVSVSIIFNVAHDAVHNTYSRKKWVNHLLYNFSFLLIGDNGKIWKLRHIQSHHNYINIPGMDVDLEVVSLLRFSENTPYKPVHRFQQFYAWFIYLFYSLYWVTVSDFKYLFKDKLLGFVKVKHPVKEFFWWLLCKGVYFGYIILIPILFSKYTWWQILVGFMIMHACNSMFILGNLLCTHLFDKATFGGNINNTVKLEWAVHQVENCQDYSINSKFFNWILGGENTHTAHHLFPKIAHAHYIIISKIIKETAPDYQVNYRDVSLWEGLKSHFRLLKKMGQPLYSEEAVPGVA